jgi:hypothetical protein
METEREIGGKGEREIETQYKGGGRQKAKEGERKERD